MRLASTLQDWTCLKVFSPTRWFARFWFPISPLWTICPKQVYEKSSAAKLAKTSNYVLKKLIRASGPLCRHWGLKSVQTNWLFKRKMWFGPGVRSQKCGRRNESKHDCEGQVVAAVNGVSEPSRCTGVLTDGSRLRHWREFSTRTQQGLIRKGRSATLWLVF